MVNKDEWYQNQLAITFNQVDGYLIDGRKAHHTMAKIIIQSVMLKLKGISFMFWGDSQIGKTETASNLLLELDVGSLRKIPSMVFMGRLLRIHNFTGLPYREEGLTRQSAMGWFDDICSGKHGKSGVIVLDEFNQVPEEVEMACHELLRNNSLFGRKLPDGWVVIAMANPPGEGGFTVAPLGRAVTNRLVHFRFAPDPMAFVDYFSNGRQPAVVKQEELLNVSPNRTMHPYLVQYLEDNPTHVMTTHPLPLDDMSKTAPTPGGYDNLDVLAKSFGVLPADNSKQPLTTRQLDELEQWARATVGSGDVSGGGKDTPKKSLSAHMRETIATFGCTQWKDLLAEFTNAQVDKRQSNVTKLVKDLNEDGVSIVVDGIVADMAVNTLSDDALLALNEVFTGMRNESVVAAWSRIRVEPTCNSNVSVFNVVGKRVSEALCLAEEV